MNLKELARELGLSQTTVSRALNGYPEVSEATRRRVKTVAAEHGYRPSRHAQLLATGRSRTIGHVIPLSRHMMINPHFSDFIAGAGEVYASHGYDMLISVVPEADQEQLYRSIAAGNRVDGVIVHTPKVREPRIPLLQTLGIPFIVHGRSDDPAEGYLWMDIDNRRSFERATRLLIDLGHHRISLLNGPEEMNFASRRRVGYLAAHKAAGLPTDESIMFSDEMIEPNGYMRTRQVLELADRPTALLTSSTLMAMGALRALNDAAVTVGRDVSIVTHDDQLSFLQRPGPVPLFTATRSSINQAGARCAELLIRAIESPDNPPESELWETELIVGTSTGPVV